MLAAIGLALALLPQFHGAVEHGQQLRALYAQRIERPGLDQAFQNALVQQAQVHMLAEFHQVLKASQLLARRHHGFDGGGDRRS